MSDPVDPTQFGEMFGAALVDAVAKHFFRPQPTGVTMVRDGQGNATPVINYGEAPWAGMAAMLYHQNSAAIMAALWEQVSIDDLAQMIAVKIADQLSKERETGLFRSHTALTPDAEKVRKRVVELLGERMAQNEADRIIAAQGTLAPPTEPGASTT